MGIWFKYSQIFCGYLDVGGVYYSIYSAQTIAEAYAVVEVSKCAQNGQQNVEFKNLTIWI